MVIDASLALAWCFEDEANPAVDALLARTGDDGAFVPAIWQLEVANVLMLAVRRGRLGEAALAGRLRLLADLPLTNDDADLAVLRPHLMALARDTGLTVYDACYLELAERLAVPLASLDRALRVAAVARGLAVLPP